ncbi:hypothetical protein BGX28_002601 [Mortierella sp. GBA30]|nr:hypothetical protein BGX28_002601 [Mortierella sp. GBA30]
MSWNKGKTGANTLPLGPRKRMISEVGSQETDDYQRGRATESTYMNVSYENYAYSQPTAPDAYKNEFYSTKKEENSPAPGSYNSRNETTSDKKEDGTEEPKRKRRSRWAAEDEKVTIPGMPTALPTNMTPEQLEMFLLHTRLEEITRKLKTGDVLPAVERERTIILCAVQ